MNDDGRCDEGPDDDAAGYHTELGSEGAPDDHPDEDLEQPTFEDLGGDDAELDDADGLVGELEDKKSGKKGKLKRAASSAALKGGGGEEPPPPPEPIDAVENHLAFVALLADGTAPCSDEVREACRRLVGVG